MSEVYGLDAQAMPEGWTPLEALVVMKCLDEEGDVALLVRSTDGVRSWDAVGMLTAALDTQRDELRRGFVDDDESEEDA